MRILNEAHVERTPTAGIGHLAMRPTWKSEALQDASCGDILDQSCHRSAPHSTKDTRARPQTENGSHREWPPMGKGVLAGPASAAVWIYKHHSRHEFEQAVWAQAFTSVQAHLAHR